MYPKPGPGSKLAAGDSAALFFKLLAAEHRVDYRGMASGRFTDGISLHFASVRLDGFDGVDFVLAFFKAIDTAWSAFFCDEYKAETLPISNLTRDGIRGTLCPMCQDPMMLTNIKPSRLGFDLRTFKCDKCNHTEKLAVETNAKRRRSGGLRAQS